MIYDGSAVDCESEGIIKVGDRLNINSVTLIAIIINSPVGMLLSVYL